MNLRFTANGKTRWDQSPELQAKLQALHEEIRVRHAVEWASAGFFRRLLLRWRMECEFRRELSLLLPSSQTLYGSRIVVR